MPSTACQQFQAALREVWASGSTYTEMVEFFGVTKDQLYRLRDVLCLPLRLDRSKRKKPKRYRDPTPEEIAAACAEMRAKHLEARRSEPLRTYRTEKDVIRWRLDQARKRSVGVDLDQFGWEEYEH